MLRCWERGEDGLGFEVRSQAVGTREVWIVRSLGKEAHPLSLEVTAAEREEKVSL